MVYLFLFIVSEVTEHRCWPSTALKSSSSILIFLLYQTEPKLSSFGFNLIELIEKSQLIVLQREEKWRHHVFGLVHLYTGPELEVGFRYWRLTLTKNSVPIKRTIWSHFWLDMRSLDLCNFGRTVFCEPHYLSPGALFYNTIQGPTLSCNEIIR